MKYKVPVRYEFVGEFLIESDSAKQAELYAKAHCGMVLGDVHSSLPEKDVDWVFERHPTSKKIGRAVIVKGDTNAPT